MAVKAGKTQIFAMDLQYEYDLVMIRQKTRQIAALLGFEKQEQTRLAVAGSEIARNALQYAGRGQLNFFLQDDLDFVICVSDHGPGIADVDAALQMPEDGSGVCHGLAAAHRLMDAFHIDTRPGEGTRVTMSKRLPRHDRRLRERPLKHMVMTSAEGSDTQSIFAEVRQQNVELLDALAKLKIREQELADLNHELEETNKGVVALYSEIDEKAATLERINRELSETNRGIVALNAELDEKAASLQRANTIKSRFLSNMTHELRTPLGSVLSLTNLLLTPDAHPLDSEQERQVRYISKSVSELAEMVDDLLDIAKVEAGKVQVRPRNFLVGDVLAALRGMFRPLLPEGGQVELLIEEPASPLPMLYSDEGKLAQILRNLVANALKFTRQGFIKVAVEPTGDGWLAFSVSDTGVGIASEDQEKIFEEFVQLSTATNQMSKGTGLGLPLARRLAEALGGDLHVTSTLGQGSTFTARIAMQFAEAQQATASALPAKAASVLPPQAATDDTRATVSDGQAAAAHAEPPQALGGSPGYEAAGPHEVLVIDDNEISRYLVTAFLRELGLKTREARDGYEGLALARRHPPRAVVLDLLMPGITGFDVLQEFAREPSLNEIPVIIHTSQALSNYELEQLRTHACAIIAKPDGPTAGIRRTEFSQALAEVQVIDRTSFRAHGEAAHGDGVGGITLTKPTVLHIEDNEEHRYVVRLMLEDAGFRVLNATSGQEGLALAARLHPGLVILDVGLPDISGYEVCRQLKMRSATSRIPVLHLSAHFTKASDKALGLAGGADAYLVHPVEPIELQATIHALLRMRRVEEELANSLRREREARSEVERQYKDVAWANKCKDEFLATISHELRTPLNILLGYSDLMLHHPCSAEETQEALEAINRNARLQAELIEDLLDTSRIITGKLKLNVEPVALAPVVADAICNLKLAADTKGLQLHVDVADHLPSLLGDPARLQQVLWNLISNAIKFTDRGGEVRVKVQRQGSFIELCVADTGIGISPEFLPFVFERLRQEDGSTARRHGGLGLGLAITRHIVELHGGTIAVSSPGKMQGACFTACFPLGALSEQKASET